CGRPRYRRRTGAGAQRGRDADLVSRAHRAPERAPRPRASQPAADFRLGLCAGRLGDGGAVARRADDRQPARHSDGAQRVRRLFATRADEAGAGSAVLHDRDVCALRIREFQLDRHSDRRHRRAGAGTPSRSGAPRPSSHARRYAGELHHRDDCRVSAVRRKSRGGRFQLPVPGYQFPVFGSRFERTTGDRQSATGNWQLATGNWLLETGYWLLVTGYWKPATDMDYYSNVEETAAVLR